MYFCHFYAPRFLLYKYFFAIFPTYTLESPLRSAPPRRASIPTLFLAFTSLRSLVYFIVFWKTETLSFFTPFDCTFDGWRREKKNVSFRELANFSRFRHLRDTVVRVFFPFERDGSRSKTGN